MNDVAATLEALDYGEVRLRGGEWLPTEDLNGELGTTDETRILTPSAHDHRARLIDVESDELVGRARKACPLPIREERPQ